MTPEQIDRMEAGRELDILVAEKVMGLTITPQSRNSDCPVYDIKNAGRFFAPISRYSTSISAAWEVEEQIDKLNLRREYLNALNSLFPWSETWPIRTDELWARVHATPVERSRAALKAVIK